jgi:hypothetical protein
MVDKARAAILSPIVVGLSVLAPPAVAGNHYEWSWGKLHFPIVNSRDGGWRGGNVRMLCIDGGTRYVATIIGDKVASR